MVTYQHLLNSASFANSPFQWAQTYNHTTTPLRALFRVSPNGTGFGLGQRAMHWQLGAIRRERFTFACWGDLPGTLLWSMRRPSHSKSRSGTHTVACGYRRNRSTSSFKPGTHTNWAMRMTGITPPLIRLCAHLDGSCGRPFCKLHLVKEGGSYGATSVSCPSSLTRTPVRRSAWSHPAAGTSGRPSPPGHAEVMLTAGSRCQGSAGCWV